MKITEFVTEDWQKTNRKDKTSGMSRKAVKQYRRENPGSKLQTAVTTKPSKLKKGSKSAKRRKSFCARMRGMKKSRTSAKTARNPNSNINKALRRWNCESIEQMQELVMIAEQKIAALRQGIAEGQLEFNTPDPVVVVQDNSGKILDTVNLSVAAQKYQLGRPDAIKKQLAHQNYTMIGNYTIVSPMTGQPQDATTQGVAEGAEQQYLWHGSRQEISMLEPRQSVDTGGATGSNQNAIYATSDPKVAIAMGLTTSGSDTGMFPNDPQMVLFSGKIRKGENVYLHKLPFNGPDGKPQFVQGGNSREFHSVPGVKGIKPIEIKAVPVDKYLNLIRQATPQDLELRKKYMKQGVAENTNPDDEKVIELFAQIVADDTGYSVKKVNYEIYDEGLRTPSGIPVYFYSFDGDVRYIGALPGGKPTAIVNQDGEVGSRGSHLELSIGGQVEYVIKGKTLFSAADQQQIAKAKPGGDEYSLVLIALDLMWGRMQHKFMEQGAAEDQEDIVAIIDGVRSNRTYNDRYHAHNSLSKLVGYGKAKVAELYINGEKIEHFELGKKYIDFEPKSLGSMSEAGPFSYGAKKPRKGSVADLAAKKRQEQEKGKLPAEPKDHMVGTARIIK